MWSLVSSTRASIMCSLRDITDVQAGDAQLWITAACSSPSCGTCGGQILPCGQGRGEHSCCCAWALDGAAVGRDQCFDACAALALPLSPPNHTGLYVASVPTGRPQPQSQPRVWVPALVCPVRLREHGAPRDAQTVPGSPALELRSRRAHPSQPASPPSPLPPRQARYAGSRTVAGGWGLAGPRSVPDAVRALATESFEMKLLLATAMAQYQEAQELAPSAGETVAAGDSHSQHPPRRYSSG
mmetsp:Transcript_25078/g.70862  ORF Transcript_25078/g.70862 Transcript_25078/m.70862 type:complete len:242 (-) Transcript_25078:402-1127(-)